MTLELYAISHPASQPPSDQREGRRSTASWLVPTQLVPEGQQRPGWYQPSWCPHSLQTSALERCGWRMGLEIFGSKRMGAPARWVPARSLFTSWHQLGGYQPSRCYLLPCGWSLAGWLALLISLSPSYSAGLKAK